MANLRRILLLPLVAACIGVLLPAIADAMPVHGVLRVVKGNVQVKSGKSGKITKARLGQKVFPKDTIITAKDSRAKVVMVDKNVINVSPASEVVFQDYEYDPDKNKKNVLLNVLYGKVRSKVNQKYDGKTTKFQVKTPSAVAGVRGTDFFASYSVSSKATEVVTFEGEVSFGLPGPNGEIRNPVAVRVGEVSQNIAGAPPAPPKVVPPSQLAMMDKSSNAESADSSSQDERQPANDKAKKKDNKSKSNNNGPDKSESVEKDDGDGKDSAKGGDDQDAVESEDDNKGKKADNDKKGPRESRAENNAEGDRNNEGKRQANADKPDGEPNGPRQANQGPRGPNTGGPEGPRGPTSVGGPEAPTSMGPPPLTGPEPGAPPSMFMPDDMPTGPDGDFIIGGPEMNIPRLPVDYPTYGEIPKCEFCDRTIENNTATHLIIRVTQ